MLNLSIPDHIRPLRDKVLQFVEQEIYPVESDILVDRVASRRDGADEVHIQNTGTRILRRFARGEGFDFGLR